MKKMILIVMILTIPVMLFSNVRDSGTFSFGGFGGLGMPKKPDSFKNYYKNDFGFGGICQYNLSETASFGLSYTYLPFKVNEDKYVEEAINQIPAGINIDNVNIDVAVKGGVIKSDVISANLIIYFNPSSAPAGVYMSVGCGYYMIKPENATISGSISAGTYQKPIQEVNIEGGDSEDVFGVNGCVGLEFNVGESLGIFIEGKYHYLFTKEEKVKVEGNNNRGKFQFITVLGGIRIGLGGN